MTQNINTKWNMDTKIKMTTKALKVFFIIDFGVVVFCLLSQNTTWLLNTQVAFFSSLIVTVASYMGYKHNIQKRVQTQVNDDDNYDELDKMDDTYDLYSPEVEQIVVNENPTKEEIKEAMKPIKQNHFANFKSSFTGMASFYRLFGYVGLIVGFFYLNNNGFLHIYSYIIGFLIVPISALFTGFALRKS